MKSLRIFSLSFQLLAEIDDYEYLMFRRSYHGIGKFELRINSNKKHVDKLQIKNLVMVGNDPKRVGIIQHKEIGLDSDGNQSYQWVITGTTLEGITKQRVIIPPEGKANDYIKGAGETVMKHYVNNHLANPENPLRKMPSLVVMPDQERGKEISFYGRYGNLGEDLLDMSKFSGLGWEMNLNLKEQQFEFECFEGTDRTTRQDIYPPVIFSTEYGTLKSASYEESELEFKNVAYVGGQGEGTDRLVVEVGEGDGLDRFEMFYDASIVDGEEVSEDTEITEADLIKQGESELASLIETTSFEASADATTSPFIFERDWFLGDIVTVIHRDWNIVMHARATAIQETYDTSGTSFSVEFGKGKTTIISKIKEEIRQYKNSSRK